MMSIVSSLILIRIITIDELGQRRAGAVYLGRLVYAACVWVPCSESEHFQLIVGHKCVSYFTKLALHELTHVWQSHLA